jgi:hypothetical protein
MGSLVGRKDQAASFRASATSPGVSSWGRMRGASEPGE